MPESSGSFFASIGLFCQLAWLRGGRRHCQHPFGKMCQKDIIKLVALVLIPSCLAMAVKRFGFREKVILLFFQRRYTLWAK